MSRCAYQLKRAILAASLAAMIAAGCRKSDTTTAGPAAETLASARGGAPVYDAKVVARFPHSVTSFTQGLEFRDGVLYEGTGQYGESSLRIVDLETGSARNLLKLDKSLFGEGITVWQDRIFQLTWKSGRAFVYDRATLRRVGEFRYDGEGWGLTHDGARLIMSDGSSRITFRDPDTFARIGEIEVRDASVPIDQLNELEYIDGEIFANVWQTSDIVRIDPGTGAVIGWIDLSELARETKARSSGSVLNGIAYDAESKRLFVTGKYWPTLFEIELMRR